MDHIMDQIIIPIEYNENIDLQISINNIEVDHTINGNTIQINHNIVVGVNLLKITSFTSATIKITDFILNKVSSRQTLYLAFSENNNKHCTTWLTENDNSLIIPFGNPLAWWLSECAKKIPNTVYGTNLYDQYNIHYPESVPVSDKFPRLIRDFMHYNLGFHIYKKDALPMHNKLIPYVKVDVEYDEQALFREFEHNIKLLENNYFKPKQNAYNTRDTEPMKLWQVAMAVTTVATTSWKETIVYSKEDFPLFHQLLHKITAIGGVRIIHVIIGTVAPESYVAPHVDDFYKHQQLYTNTYGCSQFFIPIGWKPGNYFKFNDVGLVPYDQGALIVNNSDFMHGSINASDTVRFTIGIVCEFTNDNILKLIDIA